MNRVRVLIAEDKENMRHMLTDLLGERHDVVAVDDGARALAQLADQGFEVVVSDIRMPGLDGHALLEQIKRSTPDVEVILLTAYGSVAQAVEAMRNGAFHYLTKPFEPDELLLAVERAAERRRLSLRARHLKRELDSLSRLGKLVGHSPPMQRLFGLIRRAGRSEVAVLITGESGTGKELVARAVHEESERSGPFVPVNCGALPEALIESELFGRVKGAFTGATTDKRGLFEEANHGTIFLDELGDLPLAMQVKLTRVLQESAVRRVGDTRERKVDVRVIAATNVDVKRAMEEGTFRQDLYYRLNVFSIKLPPLRDRTEDIPALCAHFLQAHAHDAAAAIDGFTPGALGALVAHRWPGNVRELENTIQRALAVAPGPRIDLEDLPDDLVASDARIDGSTAVTTTQLSHREYVEMVRARGSREYLVALLEEFGGNVTRAAERAGTERESLHRLLRRHGIQPRDYKGH